MAATARGSNLVGAIKWRAMKQAKLDGLILVSFLPWTHPLAYIYMGRGHTLFHVNEYT